MADRDVPRTDDESGPRPDRDPNALAAWRRVAEQRRRRTEERGPDDGTASGSGGSGASGASGASGGEPSASPRTGTAAVPTTPPTTQRHGGSDASAGSRHDLLLAMAGRIDDDALGTVRELAAVDDAAAAELLGGCLLADGVAVSDDERDRLQRWFAGARVDEDLLDALPVDGDAADRVRHRFVSDLSGVPTGGGESVARAAARLSGVAHVAQCWRVTPAGGSPGPLPHRVVLVETDSPDDREHVARHVGHAAAALGAVSVEVYATGAPLPAYQRDAVAAARSLGGTTPTHPHPTTTGTPAGAALPVRRRPGAEVGSFASLIARAEGGGLTRAGDDDARTVHRPAPGDEYPGVTDAPGSFRDLPVEERDVPGDLGDVGDVGDVEDRRDSEGWRVVADADRGVATGGWSMAGATGTEEPGRLDDPPGVDEPATAIEDLDPDAAAARIAALWREPSAVDAFDVPLDPGAYGPNLLEPDLPEPDLASELARYDAPRPVTGSFERVDGDPPARATGRHGSDEEPDASFRGLDVDREARTGDVPASPGDPAPESGRIRRARHSRSGADDEPGQAIDHDARHGPDRPLPCRRDGGDAVFASPVDLGAASTTPTPSPTPREDPGPAAAASRRDESPTGPVALGGAVAGPGAGPGRPDPTRHDGGPDLDDAVSQLSDRERDLLARLHAELAARERLESGEPDPFAPGADTLGGGAGPVEAARSERRPPAPRPSPTPRAPDGGRADVTRSNGHHHGPTNGHTHGPVNGHGLGSGPDDDHHR